MTTTLLLSAGDASGDVHAAEFVRAYRALRGDVRFLGLGGPAMAEAGVEIVVPQHELAVGGFVELLGNVRGIVSAWRRLGAALEHSRPDGVVLVDSGGFNLPFAARVRRRSRAPILYYVAPQVWAWRPGRIRKLAQRVDRLLVIFPFEPAFYERTSLQVDFVGHPLVERLAPVRQRLDRAAACRRLGLDPARRWIALLPGSRRNELRHQLPLQLEAAARLALRAPDLGFVLALAPSLAREELELARSSSRRSDAVPVEVVEGETHACVRASEVALAKPGSVTLEVALLERPMVVMGRANPLSAAIVRRAVRVPFFAMPNLIAGHAVVPELLQEHARPDAIASALEALLAGPARERQLEQLALVERRLGGGGAAGRAARLAEETLGAAAA